MQKKTVILGASENPERYSYQALNMLTDYDHPVIAIGKSGGKVDGIEIHKQPVPENNVDTVTLYLNPSHQTAFYDYILSLHPHRIIFNPGTENPELVKLAESAGIQCINACTLVLLATGQY